MRMRNKQAIIFLFVSNIISGFAQGISMIAIPWYFIHNLKQGSLFSSFYLVITALILFWGLYAGTIIDRYSRKKIFIYTNLICGSIITTIAVFGFINNYIPSYLVLMVFALTMFNYNIHYPNLYAFVQEITEKKYYGKLNSYIEIQGQVTSMLGGAFAALLLSDIECSVELPFSFPKWNIQQVLLMDGISYFIGAVIFFFIKFSSIVKDKVDLGSILSRLKGGLYYLRNNKSIFRFGVLSYMLFAFTIVQVHMLTPIYIDNFLNEEVCVYAFAESFYSFGAILSGFLVYRLLSSYNQYLSIAFLILSVSFAFLFLVFFKSLIFFFFTMFFLGITNAGVRILRVTYLFNNIPNNVIGRATSVFSSINVLVRMSLIGMFSSSFFFEDDNIRWGYFIGFILLFFTGVFMLFINSKQIKN